jgi:hypothetical protein
MSMKVMLKPARVNSSNLGGSGILPLEFTAA